jgi:hypothetical protein
VRLQVKITQKIGWLSVLMLLVLASCQKYEDDFTDTLTPQERALRDDQSADDPEFRNPSDLEDGINEDDSPDNEITDDDDDQDDDGITDDDDDDDDDDNSKKSSN